MAAEDEMEKKTTSLEKDTDGNTRADQSKDDEFKSGIGGESDKVIEEKHGKEGSEESEGGDSKGPASLGFLGMALEEDLRETDDPLSRVPKPRLPTSQAVKSHQALHSKQSRSDGPLVKRMSSGLTKKQGVEQRVTEGAGDEKKEDEKLVQNQTVPVAKPQVNSRKSTTKKVAEAPKSKRELDKREPDKREPDPNTSALEQEMRTLELTQFPSLKEWNVEAMSSGEHEEIDAADFMEVDEKEVEKAIKLLQEKEEKVDEEMDEGSEAELEQELKQMEQDEEKEKDKEKEKDEQVIEIDLKKKRQSYVIPEMNNSIPEDLWEIEDRVNNTKELLKMEGGSELLSDSLVKTVEDDSQGESNNVTVGKVLQKKPPLKKAAKVQAHSRSASHPRNQTIVEGARKRAGQMEFADSSRGKKQRLVTSEGDVSEQWGEFETLQNMQLDQEGNLQSTNISLELATDADFEIQKVRDVTSQDNSENQNEEDEDEEDQVDTETEGRARRPRNKDKHPGLPLNVRRANAHMKAQESMKLRLQKERERASKAQGLSCDHGRWTRLPVGDSHEWRFMSLGCKEGSTCREPVAEAKLQAELSLQPNTAVEELLRAISDPVRWYANTDKAQRVVMCGGTSRQARHERPWWCTQASGVASQAGPGGRLSEEVDEAERSWRVEAIARQRAKFAQLTLVKAYRHEQQLLNTNIKPVLDASAKLEMKKKNLQIEEEKLLKAQADIDAKLRNWERNYEDELRFFEDIEIEEVRAGEKLAEAKKRVELERKNEDVLGAFMDERNREKMLKEVERQEIQHETSRADMERRRAEQQKKRQEEKELENLRKEEEEREKENVKEMIKNMTPEEREIFQFEREKTREKQREAREEERLERERFRAAKVQKEEFRQLALHRALRKMEKTDNAEHPVSKFVNIKKEAASK